MHTLAALAAIAAATILSVAVHELGHYFAARSLRWPLRAFGVGLGPLLFERRGRNGTYWRLGLLPIGGYVILRPRAPDGEIPPRRATLLRMVILAAGPGANLALAVSLYAGVALVAGVTTYLPVASAIEAASPAEKAGFREDDRIISTQGHVVQTFDEVRPILRANADRRVTFIVDRRGQRLQLAARLAAREEDGTIVGHLGIWTHVSKTRTVGPGKALGLGASRTWQAVAETFRIVANAAHGRRTETDSAGLAGLQDLAREAGKGDVAGAAVLAAILSIEISKWRCSTCCRSPYSTGAPCYWPSASC